MDIAKFKKLPIIGILRGIESNCLEPVMEAAACAGLEAIEITMNTRSAAGLIEKAKKNLGGNIAIGAGTVLDMESLKKALDAGASFIVMPVLVKEVVEYCKKRNIPVFPGALTPQEVYDAWKAGATMVKVFPAGLFGPKYFKELKGPFSDIELLACGGVTADNMKEYFTAGASAFAFGASVFKADWLKAKDFASIGASVKRIVDATKALGL